MAHIPSSKTAEISILSFREALLGSVGEDYDRNTWIYVPDFYSEYRYILGTRGKNPLITIGINPSTASPNALDNTLKSVERIALGNGFDSFIMFNVYAQRATDPDKMETEFNPILHRENMEAFEYVLSSAEAPKIWAAWGTIILQKGLPPTVRHRHDRDRKKSRSLLVHLRGKIKKGRTSPPPSISEKGLRP